MQWSREASTKKHQQRIWWWVKQHGFARDNRYRPMYPRLVRSKPEGSDHAQPWGKLGTQMFRKGATHKLKPSLSGDNLFSAPKVSWSFSNSDLRHLWHSLDSDHLPVPETLWSSSYSEPLPAVPNTTTHSSHPSTSPNISSKGFSKTVRYRIPYC